MDKGCGCLLRASFRLEKCLQPDFWHDNPGVSVSLQPKCLSACFLCKKNKKQTKTSRRCRCRTKHCDQPDVFSLGFQQVGFHLVYFCCRACSESLWSHIWTLTMSVCCCRWPTSKNDNKLQCGTIKCLKPAEIFIGSDLQLSRSSSGISDSC